jgi:arylsulfatase
MAYAFRDPQAETRRHTQYYAMLGTRAIYHRGWKAVARHGALLGKGRYMDDVWELYHVAEDRSERTDLAVQFPDKVKELVATWFAVAGRHNGFPLDDRTALEILTSERPSVSKGRDSYHYYAHTAPVPEEVGPNIRNRSYSIAAELSLTSPEAAGVVFSAGSRFGGHTLFVKDQHLHYVYNFLGIEEQHIAGTEPLTSGTVIVGVEFAKDAENPRGVANGALRLFIGDRVAGEVRIRTQPGAFGLGEGLSVGRDVGDAVSSQYGAPFPFVGGEIRQVTVNTRGDHYVDLEREALAALARE